MIISGLLFVIIVIQVLVLLPRDVENQEPLLSQKKTVRGSKKGSARKLPKGIPTDTKAGQVVFDAYMVEAKPEGKELELWSARAVSPKAVGEWTLDDVRVKFYASNGVVYTVTGKTGGVQTETYAMWVRGNVVTRSSNGYTFKSESVFYDPKAKRLSAPTAVQMEGPVDKEGARLELIGDGMTADMGTNQLKIAKDVKAKRHIPHGRVAQIQSNTALFSGKTNSAQFSGAVVIDIEAMRITGPRAEFAYDPTTGTLESVEVAGGVRVTEADRFATSGSLSIHFRDDRYVFRGTPRVVQVDDELFGDEIIFLDGGKKVQVLNVKAQIDPERVGRDNREQAPNKEEKP
ncbi:MAG: LPS export ABC transporter periplasmic protein LptC [Bdellovibrionales bacterium]|nr:LPS export ABC transporter periplasmic protein LptC [Bdellovibrionales bacterium]